MLLTAALQATEEAIVNVMGDAETVTGAGRNTVSALPHDLWRDALSSIIALGLK